MARATKVVWDKQCNQWRKNIGNFKTITGVKRPQRFWLGRDEAAAKAKAVAIEARRQAEALKGYDYWTETVLDAMANEGLTQHRKGRKADVAVASAAVLPLAVVKLDPIVAQWLDKDGAIKPEHYLDFQKHAITKLIGQDQHTQILLNQVNEQWHNDALTTLERITKLNIAPNQINIGFTGNGFIANPVDLDVTANGGKSVLDLIEGEIVEPKDKDDKSDKDGEDNGDTSTDSNN